MTSHYKNSGSGESHFCPKRLYREGSRIALPIYKVPDLGALPSRPLPPKNQQPIDTTEK